MKNNDMEQLSELLVAWEELRRQGQDPSVDELCAAHPHLLSPLRQRIEALQKMETLLGVNREDTDDSQASLPGAIPSVPGYEVHGVLGRGGMGVVYRATQQKLGRTVALKMLDASLVDTQQLERFFDEAKAIARLHHRNIVQIFDFGQIASVPYYAMEFVDGGSLREKLQSGPFETEEAARLTEVIARAIHAVHLQGFAHRDLKPANVLVTAGGEPKVTDFGLVKQLESDAGHTSTGEILGTIGYMAPEQLDHTLGDVGPGTDVYAIGSLLFELLVGEPAFGASPALAIRHVLQGHVQRPSKSRPEIPRDLEAICLKCLEKRSEDRYQSAQFLADDLRRFLEHRPVLARAHGPLRRGVKWIRRKPLVALAALLFVALCVWPVSSLVGRARAKAATRDRAEELAPQVREILTRNCLQCHGKDDRNIQKQLDVMDYAHLIDSDRRLVVPGQPGESRLLQRIEDGSMPPEEDEEKLPRLTEEELTVLKQWVIGGAPPFDTSTAARAVPPVVVSSPAALQAKQLFRERCYSCHKYSEAKGGIKILHHRLLLHVRKVVIPGDAENSELFRLVTSDDRELIMPPKDYDPLSTEEIEIVRRWIDEGALPFPKSAR